MFINRKPGLRLEFALVLGVLSSTGARALAGSKRYRGSYAFADESLLLGGIFLILSTAFDDLESFSELYATADSLVIASAVAANPMQT